MKQIGKGWTLFLDRDGVINERLENEYVKTPEQFVFIEGVEEAIATSSKIFGRIIVLTNQQGIGKGLMTIDQLQSVHAKMKESVREAGGRIDEIFFAPDLANQKSFLRKPNIGMPLLARRKFTDIHFRESVMLGDSLCDVQMGKRLGMRTVLVANPSIAKKHPKLVDYYFADLATFASYLRNL